MNIVKLLANNIFDNLIFVYYLPFVKYVAKGLFKK